MLLKPKKQAYTSYNNLKKYLINSFTLKSLKKADIRLKLYLKKRMCEILGCKI